MKTYTTRTKTLNNKFVAKQMSNRVKGQQIANSETFKLHQTLKIA